LPHPDGMCFPASYRTFASIRAGTSNTLLATESVESRFARWTVGAESAVVGLPRNVQFETYAEPKGFDLAVKGDEGSVYWGYHTYLDWDYDKNPYDGADGAQGGKYGPSGSHGNVVMHLFADGSAQPLDRDINISIYIRLIRGRDF